ncbi:unnamed protein product [Rangifer tarandus platyrhynchus]|uniref:Uncharacterized protein n=2 Tax=Rangifer tarandus platyrhynchus TaxID=3082113 RepID=A0ACB0EDT3_RANTA|nr:unnamed protein product [Rangifer tarandus platyrhynchus]CAI9698638.1 unnamed protein product [Rangifer tarandus platyrhynchus]
MGNARGGEWAGARARLKDGCRRSAATAPEVTVGPAASARAREPPPPPYHEASESPHPRPDLFRVASRGRIALLGIRHLCINCSCTTTTKQGIPRQNLRNERIFVIPLDLISCIYSSLPLSDTCLDLK